jgi:exodeoxyribonuclease VII large subunit
LNVLDVSSLNEQIKSILESTFSHVMVEGELSRITFHNSGHIYFTLKDSSSAISCVMFRGNASKLKFELKEGMKIIINGAITLYKPRGSYQINCFGIEPSGKGALALAYEQLKQKLFDKGYFLENRKKQLTKFPKKIALITSATGAAVQDMLKVANTRYRALEIDIYDVLVQGENAASSIARAIKIANLQDYDFMVIGRGGGSIEDLWAFNEEIVAEAIYDSAIPIVSAVGHEIDNVISDYVADLRAPTPSAAMEMVLPDSNELLLSLDSISNQFSQIINQKILTKKQTLQYLLDSYKQHSMEKKLTLKLQEIKYLKDSFTQVIDSKFIIAQNQVSNLQKMLESNHPKHRNKKGFAQLSQNSKIIDISKLKIDDMFDVMNDKMKISAKVLSKNNL